jgi:hypothetical protein
MTLQIDRRLKRRGSCLSLVRLLVFIFYSREFSIGIAVVRKYVEAMKDSGQLLDLLAVAGSNDIEPTMAVAGRTALYPDVRPHFVLFYCLIFTYGLIVSSVSNTTCGCQGWRATPRAFQCESISLFRGKL